MQASAALLAATLLFACSAPTTETTAVTTATAPTQAAVVETFEVGTKGAYATAPEKLATGTWLFTDALIGSSSEDHKAGEHAARLRPGGRLTMQFDAPAGVRRISIKAAAYGSDGPSTWELWLSRDHGRTWQRNGQPQTTSGSALRPAIFAGTATEAIRLEIRKTGTDKNRLNLDDISLETGGVVVVPTKPAPAPTTPAPTPTPQPQLPTAGTRPDNDNLLLGNPSGATSDPTNTTNYLLIHPARHSGLDELARGPHRPYQGSP
jgi:endonuclease G